MTPTTKRLLFALGAFLLLTAALSKNTDLAWSRTTITRPAPAGRGCSTYNPASTSFILENNGTNTDSLFQLPLQVTITNTGTAAATVCATQDPAATINRFGYFSAGTAYSAGPGNCKVVVAGAQDVYMGVDTDSFFRTGAGWPVGAVPALIGQTYLIMNKSVGDLTICEVQ